MAKLRKMLGDIQSQECIALMRLIETQSQTTLAKWAIAYVRAHCLPVYRLHGGSERAEACISGCEAYLVGTLPMREAKELLRELTQLAQHAQSPVQQAAARAISVGCAVLRTPTNALGFLFYASAAQAYHQAGVDQPPAVYDAIATKLLREAYESLRNVAVPDESNPTKINFKYTKRACILYGEGRETSITAAAIHRNRPKSLRKIAAPDKPNPTKITFQHKTGLHLTNQIQACFLFTLRGRGGGLHAADDDQHHRSGHQQVAHAGQSAEHGQRIAQKPQRRVPIHQHVFRQRA